MNRPSRIVKRIAVTLAAMALVFATLPGVARADSSRIVTLGADLNAEERAKVLDFFGLSEDDLTRLQVITVTNADERDHFASTISTDIIGNKTYSCSYIEPTTSGGIYVKTANLTYVTNNMLYNALQTAGVRNCNLVVTAPFPVSGTGALTGVFMAYEAEGQSLDKDKEEAATEELVTTAELGETYGNGVAEVISEVKDQVISSAGDLSDDQIRDIIRTVAAAKGIPLSDGDLDRIMELIAHLQELDYDSDAFATTLSDFEAKLNELTQQAEQAGFFDAIGGFFKGIADWFMGLINGGNTPSVEDVSQGAQDFFSGFNTDVFSWDNAQ